MERLLTVEEKIRRAEDIYRRKNPGVRVEANTIGSKRDFKLFKKMFIQMLICICIYCAFYIVKMSETISAQSFRDRVKEILEYDVDFGNIYSGINQYFSNDASGEDNEDLGAEENNKENEEITINAITDEAASYIEDILSIAEVLPEEESSIDQAKIDAEYIKNNFPITSPLKGTITSRFGLRNPTTPTVPKYHSGIDIAANKGTKFVAAMEGTVTLVSSSGDFGKHFIITNGNVTTLYAHCNKIYVKQGEKVKQGQEIGEVGATGNATGPHLHFEIQVDGRLVNPDYILNF